MSERGGGGDSNYRERMPAVLDYIIKESETGGGGGKYRERMPAVSRARSHSLTEYSPTYYQTIQSLVFFTDKKLSKNITFEKLDVRI